MSVTDPGAAIRIREAVVADAARLSELAAITFRETFESDNTPEDMARYLSAAFTPARQAAEIAEPGSKVLLAELQGAVHAEFVGYVHLAAGPAPAAVRGTTPLELKRLYVAREWHGRGVAHALMNAALDAARRSAAETLWLGVWERNARAIAFYAKYGFVRVGEHTFILGDDAQTDWLLSRSLRADQATHAAEVRST